MARGGSVASFIHLAGEFVGKDLARGARRRGRLDTGLGVLEDVIDATL
ncbi:hypothetical protein H7I76_17220 [Mycolicibacterium vaccae]|nr:hypothetical protein [Mycolicibacterium vaccae]